MISYLPGLNLKKFVAYKDKLLGYIRNKESALLPCFIVISVFILPTAIKILSDVANDLKILDTRREEVSRKIQSIVKDNEKFIELLANYLSLENANPKTKSISSILDECLSIAHASANDNLLSIKSVRLAKEDGQVYGPYGEVKSNESAYFRNYLRPLSSDFPTLKFIFLNEGMYLGRSLKTPPGYKEELFVFILINNFPIDSFITNEDLKYFDVNSEIDLNKLNTALKNEEEDLSPFIVQANINPFKLANENYTYLIILSLISVLLLCLNIRINKHIKRSLNISEAQLNILKDAFSAFKYLTEKYLDGCVEKIEERREIAKFIMETKKEESKLVLNIAQEQALLTRISDSLYVNNNEQENPNAEFDIVELIENCINLVQYECHENEIKVNFKSKVEKLYIKGDSFLFFHLILKLLSISLSRASKNNTVSIILDGAFNNRKNLVNIEIIDDGYSFDLEKFKFFPDASKHTMFPVKELTWSETEELAASQNFKIICNVTKSKKNRINLSSIYNEKEIIDEGIETSLSLVEPLNEWPENVVPFKK